MPRGVFSPGCLFSPGRLLFPGTSFIPRGGLNFFQLFCSHSLALFCPRSIHCPVCHTVRCFVCHSVRCLFDILFVVPFKIQIAVYPNITIYISFHSRTYTYRACFPEKAFNLYGFFRITVKKPALISGNRFFSAFFSAMVQSRRTFRFRNKKHSRRTACSEKS